MMMKNEDNTKERKFGPTYVSFSGMMFPRGEERAKYVPGTATCVPVQHVRYIITDTFPTHKGT